MTERFDRDGDWNRIKCRRVYQNSSILLPGVTNIALTIVEAVRSRTAPAELALAIVMQDKELWANRIMGLFDYMV